MLRVVLKGPHLLMLRHRILLSSLLPRCVARVRELVVIRGRVARQLWLQTSPGRRWRWTSSRWLHSKTPPRRWRWRSCIASYAIHQGLHVYREWVG